MISVVQVRFWDSHKKTLDTVASAEDRRNLLAAIHKLADGNFLPEDQTRCRDVQEDGLKGILRQQRIGGRPMRVVLWSLDVDRQAVIPRQARLRLRTHR